MKKWLLLSSLLISAIANVNAQADCSTRYKVFVTHNRKYNLYLVLDTITGYISYEGHEFSRHERYGIIEYLKPYTNDTATSDTAFICQTYAVVSGSDSLILFTRAGQRLPFDIFCLCRPKLKAFKICAFYPATDKEVLEWLAVKNRLSDTPASDKFWQIIYSDEYKNKQASLIKEYAAFKERNKFACPDEYQELLETFVNEILATK
ncbi:MAG: hypothetical protein RL660_2930 [Bacteroidota bacterium]|jgi:hypothetical protein